jgi:hypothetical protein
MMIANTCFLPLAGSGEIGQPKAMPVQYQPDRVEYYNQPLMQDKSASNYYLSEEALRSRAGHALTIHRPLNNET